MTQSIQLESTPAMQSWHTASNTLSGYCEILADSAMVKDADADYRLQEAVALVKRLATECDNSTVNLMEEYNAVRTELEALKLKLDKATRQQATASN